jgi:hypothetical protein
MSDGPKVLVFDIETAPILAYSWDIWEQNIALNQIVKDWCVISWAAKWLSDPPEKIMYQDQRNAKTVRDDKALIKGMWRLLDEADIVVTQNGKKFDTRKLNARFIIHGLKPPASYRHFDTYQVGKRLFAFTSHKLQYMAEVLGVEFQKLSHPKFPGQELWNECLKGNLEAWKEMETYNKHDVLATEGVYNKIQAWDGSINFNVYRDDVAIVCNCGHPSMHRIGYAYTTTGKFQRFRCNKCGRETRSKVNMLTKEKKLSLRGGS